MHPAASCRVMGTRPPFAAPGCCQRLGWRAAGGAGCSGFACALLSFICAGFRLPLSSLQAAWSFVCYVMLYQPLASTRSSARRGSALRVWLVGCPRRRRACALCPDACALGIASLPCDWRQANARGRTSRATPAAHHSRSVTMFCIASANWQSRSSPNRLSSSSAPTTNNITIVAHCVPHAFHPSHHHAPCTQRAPTPTHTSRRPSHAIHPLPSDDRPRSRVL